MPNVVSLDFVGDRRTWSDQRHLAFEHIDKLRQLVKAAAAQETADTSDSRVLGQFINAVAIAVPRLALRVARDQLLDVGFVSAGIVVDVHGSEFQENKLLAVLPDSLLPEKDGALRCHLDGDGNGQENRREKQQGKGAADDIHDPLDRAKELLRTIPTREIRIQSGIAGPLGNIVIPLFRK